MSLKSRGARAMIPASAITMKSAADLKLGEIGYYFTPSPTPFVAGLIQTDMVRVALFGSDQTRVVRASNLSGPVAVIGGAEIEVDPHSGRKASLGELTGCLVFSGSNRLLELEYQSAFLSDCSHPACTKRQQRPHRFRSLAFCAAPWRNRV
jgi:hypothetical protein